MRRCVCECRRHLPLDSARAHSEGTMSHNRNCPSFAIRTVAMHMTTTVQSHTSIEEQRLTANKTHATIKNLQLYSRRSSRCRYGLDNALGRLLRLGLLACHANGIRGHADGCCFRKGTERNCPLRDWRSDVEAAGGTDEKRDDEELHGWPISDCRRSTCVSHDGLIRC